MSGDTQNWRPLISSATNKLNSFKGYLASKDPRPLTPTPSLAPNRGGDDSSNPGAGLGPATRQTWRQWAGDKLRRNGQSPGDNANVVEKVILFPGWAARRLHQPSSGGGARISSSVCAAFLTFYTETHFDAEVYVSGFATRLNHPEFMSRSQRAFLRLAKGTCSSGDTTICNTQLLS